MYVVRVSWKGWGPTLAPLKLPTPSKKPARAARTATPLPDHSQFSTRHTILKETLVVD